MLNGHGGNIKQICDRHGLNPHEIIDFSASVNPLGCPEGVRRAISERFGEIRNYPDSECSDLRKAIADKVSCNETNIIIGNGSNELFYLLPRALKPERGFLLQPTFSEFKDALCHADVDAAEIINEDLDFPVINRNISRLKGIAGGMVFLCNPNNPTGQLYTKEDILKLVNSGSDRMIVVDEAFMDFVEDDERYSVLRDAPSMDNLIVVRSLTKFYCFPGLRLGYLAANENIVNRLMQFKEPWTVNTFAQIAGKVAVNDDGFAAKTQQFITREKTFLYEGLSAIKGIHPFQPSVNFIMVRIETDEIKVSEVSYQLAENRIIIRDCSNFTGLNDRYFRVAVRSREDNQKLIDALRLIMSETRAVKVFSREKAVHTDYGIIQ